AVAGDPRHQAIQDRARGAGFDVRVAVRLVELGVDRRVVQQVVGLLGDEADGSTTLAGALRRGVDVADAHGAPGSRARALQGPQQARLPRPVPAHEGDPVTGVEVQVDVVDRGRRTVDD